MWSASCCRISSVSTAHLSVGTQVDRRSICTRKCTPRCTYSHPLEYVRADEVNRLGSAGQLLLQIPFFFFFFF